MLSADRLCTILEGIPQLVWPSADDGRWTWSNSQWQNFTGQTQEQSQGEGWLDAIHLEDRERTTQAWHLACSSGVLDVEHRIYDAAAQSYVWHHTRSLRHTDAVALVIEWLGTSTDVSVAKKASAEKGALLK